MSWVLDEYDRRGGIGGEGVKNLLEAPGFETREDLLVREALQNSVDAHDDDVAHKVKVTFRKVTLRGKQKREFVQRLGLKQFAGIPNLLKKTPSSSPLRTIDDATPLTLLYIEDFNTVGLGGGFPDPNGNFYRLLFLVGDARKAEDQDDDGGGGSYGYGKSVYASNSSTSTIVAFSVFEPTRSTNGAYARLLGSAFHKAFEHDGSSFTGRGWYGKPKRDEKVPDPYTNDEALDLGQQLGFTPRTKNDYGTSILIVGTEVSGVDLSINQIRHAIETWWWPRYIQDRLDVELFEGAVRADPPRPKQRPDLMPFIDCFNALSSGGNGNGQDVSITNFPSHGKDDPGLGTIALKAVTSDFVDKPSSEKGAASRRVVLLRNPHMVVEYKMWGTEKKEPFVGVFRADTDVNNLLKLSEPKEHDRWDHSARRLAEKRRGPEIVERLLQRCRDEVRRFQASLAPKKEPPRDRLEALDRLLGPAFQQTAGNGLGNKKQQSTLGDIEIEQAVERLRTGSTVRIEAEVRFRLKSNAKGKPQRAVTIKPEIVILEDTSRARGRDLDDLLDLEVLDTSGKTLGKKSRRPSARIQVSKNTWTVLQIKSAPYKSDWYSELQVEVD